MRFAIVSKSSLVVETVIEADHDFVNQIYGETAPCFAVQLEEGEACSSGMIYQNETFIQPVFLEEEKQAKLLELRAACESEIHAGFISTALGSPHRYSSDEQSQLNITQAVVLGQPIPYTCTDAEGLQFPRTHTIEQLQQVISDGGALKVALIGKFHTLRLQLESADTVDQVRLISW